MQGVLEVETHPVVAGRYGDFASLRWLRDAAIAAIRLEQVYRILGIVSRGWDLKLYTPGTLRVRHVCVVRAGDGVCRGSSFVGSHPYDIAVEGANMWVGNFESNSVSGLRASDGFHVMTPTSGTGLQVIACDGAFMWVANLDGSVSKR